jgi:hypothetical protein
MDFHSGDTAIVAIEPQNDHLSEKGVSWESVGASVKENNTIENLAKLFSGAKQQQFPVLLSPHLLFPFDQKWRFAGAVEAMMLDGKEFFRPGPLNLKTSSSSQRLVGALQALHSGRQNQHCKPIQTVGISDNDRTLQLPKRNISKMIPAGTLANLCIESVCAYWPTTYNQKAN